MEYTAVTPHAYVPSQPAVKSSQPQENVLLRCKVTKNRAQNKKIPFIFYAEME